ncbi:MAG: hypothetical protein U0T84_02595 [Chitinophagales bacterium]
MVENRLQRFMPWWQWLACLLIGLIAAGIAHAAVPHGGYEFAGAFLGIVFYCLLNALVSVFHPSFLWYTLPSWALFLLLLIVLLLVARFISGSSIQAFPEYILMLKSVVGFYLIVSILARIIRALWQFAEEDSH